MSENPYQAQANPFQSPQFSGIPPQSSTNPLLIPAAILIGLSTLWILYGLVNIVFVLITGPPPPPENAPPGADVAQRIGFYLAAFLVPVLSIVALLGGVAMVRLKGYALAMTGAVVSLVPLCGPCFGLVMPISIWAIVLLCQKEVKNRFES